MKTKPMARGGEQAGVLRAGGGRPAFLGAGMGWDQLFFPTASLIQLLPPPPKADFGDKDPAVLEKFWQILFNVYFSGHFQLPADPRQCCREGLVMKREKRKGLWKRKKIEKKRKKERFCSHSENSNSTPAHRQRRLLHAAPRIKCFCLIFNTQSLLVLSCRSSPLPPTCIRSQWHPCQEN